MARREIYRYETATGRRIYRIPVEIFQEIFGNVYAITGGGKPILVDCGSGFASSDRDLAKGFEAIGERFGEKVGLTDLGAILITHGHIDHFGGVSFLRNHTAAPIGVHLLDRRVLSHYEERVVVASKHVRVFLETAGIGAERCDQYMQMYLSTKSFFRSVKVEHVFEEGELLGGEVEAYHVPGHCPGQVCLRIDDVLLTADHLLAEISPHLSPEAITQNTGVGHYLASLAKIDRLDGIRLGLGGHKGPIRDIHERVTETLRLHQERLERILEFCAEPRSIADISRALFGRVTSYHVLLALLETGALVEYLYQRGELVAANVEEIESVPNPVILYGRE